MNRLTLTHEQLNFKAWTSRL